MFRFCVLVFVCFVVSTSAKDSFKCSACKFFAAAIPPLIRANATKDVIIPIATTVCELMEKKECTGAENCATLCKGVVSEYADEVFEIASDVLTAAELCFLMKACDAPAPPPTPNGIPVKSNLSDLAGEKSWPSWSLTSGEGTFLHFSDAHVDMLYKSGTNTKCGLPICCREDNGAGGVNSTAGAWGDYNCDGSPLMAESFYHFVSTMNPKPDFVLYTGDDPAHDVWAQSREKNLASIDFLCAFMLKYFPDIPVFSSVGNHATFPVDQFKGPGYDSWLYDHFISAWGHYITTEDAKRTLSWGGYYQTRVRPGLRVISLNTNYYASGDFWRYVNNSDVSLQLNWLEDVLSQAHALKEKVIIIGHQSPQGLLSDFSDRINELVGKFADIITAQFFGHTHTASEIVFHDSSTNLPNNILYIAGGLTTFPQLNPGFREYSYDRTLSDDWLVRDYAQYWADVTESNIKNAADWSAKVPSIKAAYSLPDLSPASWAKFAVQLLTNDTLYLDYVNNYNKAGPAKLTPEAPIDCTCDILSSSPHWNSVCYNQHRGKGEELANKLSMNYVHRDKTLC